MGVWRVILLLTGVVGFFGSLEKRKERGVVFAQWYGLRARKCCWFGCVLVGRQVEGKWDMVVIHVGRDPAV